MVIMAEHLNAESHQPSSGQVIHYMQHPEVGWCSVGSSRQKNKTTVVESPYSGCNFHPQILGNLTL